MNLTNQRDQATKIWMESETKRLSIQDQLKKWYETNEEANNQLETELRVAQFMCHQYEHVHLTLTSLVERIASGRQ